MWDARYGSDEYAHGKQPNDFLKETWADLGLPRDSRCLLLAEGEGRNAVYLAEQGMSVMGVDSSSVGLSKAHKLAAERNLRIETEIADLATYDMGNSQWDAIVGIFCHLSPDIRDRVLTNIPAALKSGGYVVFECYTPDQLANKTGGPPAKEVMYSSEIFTDAFADKLEILRNSELTREVAEGKYHTGKAAVVQCIGKKT